MEPKKNPNVDLTRKSGLFMNIGFTVSLLLVILAFEWRTYDDSSLVDLGQVTDDFEDIMEMASYRAATAATTENSTSSDH